MATQAGIEMLLDKWPIVVTSIGACLVVSLLPVVFPRNLLANVPLVGEELGGYDKRRLAYLSKADELYQAGYRRFKDGFFQLNNAMSKKPVLVIPNKYLGELRELPEDVLSFYAASTDTLFTEYTGLEDKHNILPHLIKTRLTPSLPGLNPAISEEVREALRAELPPCDDWTGVNIYQKLLRMVAMVTGRVFYGPELCRSEDYLEITSNYTDETISALSAIEKVSPWLRPIVCPWLPELRTLRAREAQGARLMQPLVQSRQNMAESDRPDDITQFLINLYNQSGSGASDMMMAKMMLSLSFVAIMTTTLLATNLFNSLAAMPDFADELRDEIRDVLAACDGEFSTAALREMKKLDSFVKESLRRHPDSCSSFRRKVMKPIMLSDGKHLPVGVYIEVPQYAMAMDPTRFPNPEQFDPMRFYRLRQQQESKRSEASNNDTYYQFVSVNPDSLTWGYGRNACPGRYFVSNEIKILVANVVMNYDLRLEEGVTERYPNTMISARSFPNTTRKLHFKRRSV